MQREIAEEIVTLMREYSEKLSEYAQLIKDTCPADEVEYYTESINDIQGFVDVDVMALIRKEHPDLAPPVSDQPPAPSE